MSGQRRCSRPSSWATPIFFAGPPVDGGVRLADGTVIATAGHCDGSAIVRPEKLTVRAGEDTPRGNALRGELLQAVYSGASVTYRIRTAALGDMPLLAFIQNQIGRSPGAGIAGHGELGCRPHNSGDP